MSEIYKAWVRDLSRSLMTVQEIVDFTGFTADEVQEALK